MTQCVRKVDRGIRFSSLTFNKILGQQEDAENYFSDTGNWQQIFSRE
jgi:hypothetical protein